MLPRMEIEIDLYQVPQFLYPHSKLQRKIQRELMHYACYIKDQIKKANVVCDDVASILTDYVITTDTNHYALSDVKLTDVHDVHTFGTFSRWGYMTQGARNPNKKSTMHAPDFRILLKDHEDLYFVAYSQDGVIGMSFQLTMN